MYIYLSTFFFVLLLVLILFTMQNDNKNNNNNKKQLEVYRYISTLLLEHPSPFGSKGIALIGKGISPLASSLLKVQNFV